MYSIEMRERLEKQKIQYKYSNLQFVISIFSNFFVISFLLFLLKFILQNTQFFSYTVYSLTVY